MPVWSYLDTSFLVKGYLTEEGSSLVQKHIRDSEITLWVSSLTDMEMAATMAKRLEKSEADSVYMVYRQDREVGVYVEISMMGAIWELAVDLLLRQVGPAYLGSLDALHLATALFHGATHVATFDRRLAAAAAHRGLAVIGARL